MSNRKLLGLVALLEDLPEHARQRGRVGPPVMRPAPTVEKAEFSDDQGQSYATVALHSNQILDHYCAPIHRAT